jgi:N6-L-threonylcarbamoyladenine synthase
LQDFTRPPTAILDRRTSFFDRTMTTSPISPPKDADRGLTVLGVETSCDETAAAVLRRTDDGGVEVLSSIVGSQFDRHRPYGGVVPEIAARAHVETVDTVIEEALEAAGLGYGDLDAVAATAGPGLIGGVMVGLSAAKAIALGRGLPLIAVNHLEGHALSVRLTEKAPYPYLLLLASGGHCQLLIVEGVGRCVRLGTTIDDAAGEAFDKIGKTLGLPYPGGPALEALAEGGEASRFPLPKMLAGRKDCDFSFSGLKTAAARLAETIRNETDARDLAAAVQSAIARQLGDRADRAMGLFRERHPEAGGLIVVAGGVAANRQVRTVLEAAATRRGFAFAAPPLRFCTDNAAMIALAGLERLELGLTSPLDVAARPRWPLDETAALAQPIHKSGRKGAKA